MRKLILSAAVLATVLFAACSSDKAAEGDAIKSKIENCTNPDSIGIYVEEAKAYAEKLIAEGKVEEAKAYLEQIEPVVEKNAPSLSGVFQTVKGALEMVPEAAEQAADDVKAAGEDALEDAAAKAEAAKDSIAAKADQAVNDAKAATEEAATKAVNEGAQKATDAIKKVLK